MPSGGHNALSPEALKVRGTYRRDRHAPAIRRAKRLPVTQTREIATSWPPFHLTSVSDEEIQLGVGQEYIDFIAAHCRVTMDSVAAKAGEPLVLRRWQQELVRRLFARRN